MAKFYMTSKFLKSVSVFICAIAWLASPAHAQNPPNIVLFLVEDMSVRVGAFGDQIASTPNLDALAAEGVRFTRTFTAAPVCAPSRAALFTGLYPHSFGAQHMRSRYPAVPPPHVKAFPEILRQNGYYTINQGKTDYQLSDLSTLWDVNEPHPDLGDIPTDKPFFAVLQSGQTHESALFERKKVKTRVQEFAKLGVSCPACALARLKRFEPDDMVAPPYLPDTPVVRSELARLYSNVHVMDAWVGQQMRQLESLGLLENTIVIWTTDHGDGLPRAKRSLYDSGIQVPMIIRFPDGERKDEIDSRLISFVDLPAVILNMADVEIPEHLQHTSLDSDGFPDRTYIFAGADRMDSVVDRSRAVRSSDFKYIRNFKADQPLIARIAYREKLSSLVEMRRLLAAGELPEQIAAYFSVNRPIEELYDLRNDPFEMVNLAGEPKYAATLGDLRGKLDLWLKETGDLSDFLEDEMFQLLWEESVQPQTKTPGFSMEETGETVRLEISSETEGASIEYRFIGVETEPWQLYSEPLEVEVGALIEARATRYGFKVSPVAEQVVASDHLLID